MGADTRYDKARDRLLGQDRSTDVLGTGLPKLLRSVHGSAAPWSLYGLSPEELEHRGFSLMGRTALESVPDDHAEALISDLSVSERGYCAGVQVRAVVDPFAGSGNLLRHLSRSLGVPGTGAERDPEVYRSTAENLSLLESGPPIRLTHRDGMQLLNDRPSDALVILDPPWGDAYRRGVLDLGETSPSVIELLESLARPDRGVQLVILKANDVISPSSADAIKAIADVVSTTVIDRGRRGYNAAYIVLRL